MRLLRAQLLRAATSAQPGGSLEAVSLSASLHHEDRGRLRPGSAAEHALTLAEQASRRLAPPQSNGKQWQTRAGAPAMVLEGSSARACR